MHIEYVDHMGSDLTVVNAARVSFDKVSSLDENGNLRERDKKLIKYLAEHQHWTPFSHCQITVLVQAPIFIARQLFKHKVGLTENEVSRRYVSDDPQFFRPNIWREKAENKKQGSLVTSVREPLRVRMANSQTTDKAVTRFNEIALDLYKELLDNGTCPEQARMVLPQSMYTEWYWTGSLIAFARVYNLRSSEDAQLEHRQLMDQLATEISALYPESWKVLTNEF